MAVTFRTEQRVAGPADEVLRLMVERETHEALLRELGSVVESYSEEGDGDRVRVEVTTADPALKGAGTHRATLESVWDLPSRSCRWSRKDHTFGDRVRATGRTAVEPIDDGTCRVVETGEIDVQAPVIGKKIARTVASKMEDLAPRKAAFWEKRLRS